MEWLEKLWKFLAEETNRDILTFLGSGLLVVGGGAWTVYVYFLKEKPLPPQIININIDGTNLKTILKAVSSGGIRQEPMAKRKEKKEDKLE
ncbi:MAG: hypothetical protein IH886_16335 [Nitrospinae bacterium]|nr:hypothetical protein [Nitrospinota bacterium]